MNKRIEGRSTSLFARLSAGAGRIVRRGRRADGASLEGGARSNPVAPLLVTRERALFGGGDEWAPPSYGDYFATSPTLYACVHLRARNLARVRLRAMDKNGVPAPDDDPVQELLDRVNPFWSRQRFWYMVEASLCLWGSAPVALFRDGAGRVRELWWLNPSRFRVAPDRRGYIAGYLYRAEGAEVAFRPREVVWFRYPNPEDELAGLSPIASLRLTLDMDRDALRFNRRFFRNNATPGRVYLQSQTDLTTAQADELRLRWERAFRDPENAHRLAILDKSSELKSIGVSQREMEFIEGQRYSKEQIAGAYGVSPVLIGDLRNATLNNYRLAKQSFWDETMVPELQFLESELNEGLMPELAPGMSVRFDLGAVSSLREDETAKAQRYKLLVETGVMTINEARAKEGLRPVPWGDGPGLAPGPSPRPKGKGGKEEELP